MVEEDPGAGEWLPITTAARRLGITPRAVRGRIDRGSIEWKAAGNKGRLVLVRPGDTIRKHSRDGEAEDPGTPLGDDLEEGVNRLREELMGARIAQGRAEERAAALREALEREIAHAAELREVLAREGARTGAMHEIMAREVARAERLEAELARRRRSWWRRLLDGRR